MLTLASLLALTGTLSFGQAPPTAPVAAPPAAPPAVLPAEVEALLDRVERAGEALKTLQSGVSLVKFDAIGEETQYRIGNLVLDGVGAGRRFAVKFTKLVVQGDRGDESSDLNDRWVFENGWLWEIDADLRSLKKRQIAEEGSGYDPLKLGEGELPLPLGQPKKAVLEQFDVAAAAVPGSAPFANLTNVDGLKLVPKAGTPLAKEFSELLVFYSKPTGEAGDIATLQGVHLIHANSNLTTILLKSPKLNAPLGESDRALLTTPDLADRSWQEGWTIDVQRLARREEQAGDGSATPATPPTAPASTPAAPAPVPTRPG